MTGMPSQPVDAIRSGLQLLTRSGDVIELRVPRVGGRKNNTASGYFSNTEKAAQAAARFDRRGAGVYFTVNPVDPSLLSRAADRIAEYADLATADTNIVRRRWFLVDTDPVRAAGISSTDEEHAAAHERAQTIRAWLEVAGWGLPVYADSGNGAHLLYPIDLPNDDTNRDLVKGCLQALAARFDDATVKIDQTVFNAARIWKVYGTTACKGDNTSVRPHRRAAIIEAPESFELVSPALLHTLAASVAEPEPQRQNTTGTNSIEDVGEWLASHNISYREKRDVPAVGAITYQIDCPFSTDHVGDAYVVKGSRGGLKFGCYHNTCRDKDWRALRDYLDPFSRRPAPDTARHNGAAPAGDTPPAASAAPDTTRLTFSERILAQLKAWGYTFRLNRAGSILECNGQPLDDPHAAVLRMQYRDAGMKGIQALEDTYMSEALRNAYHPVQDYLGSLVWDGQLHISRLADCLHSSDPPIVYANGAARSTIGAYLYRWLIGAVAKVYDRKQNSMLVLGGPQGIGKSFFVRWLASPLPDHFIEQAIQPGERDGMLRFATMWIWEVGELDATTRRADRSALKAALTTETIVLRRAYGHFDTRAPAMASFIGTFNPDHAGFLDDPTGSRRFWITTIEHIDRRYSTEIDVHQVWAEAMAAYRRGVSWQLRDEEEQQRARLNEEHEVEDPMIGLLERFFILDADESNWINTAEIMLHLRDKEAPLSYHNPRALAMDIARALKKRGIKKKSNGRHRGYAGIMQR